MTLIETTDELAALCRRLAATSARSAPPAAPTAADGARETDEAAVLAPRTTGLTDPPGHHGRTPSSHAARTISLPAGIRYTSIAIDRPAISTSRRNGATSSAGLTAAAPRCGSRKRQEDRPPRLVGDGRLTTPEPGAAPPAPPMYLDRALGLTTPCAHPSPSGLLHREEASRGPHRKSPALGERSTSTTNAPEWTSAVRTTTPAARFS